MPRKGMVKRDLVGQKIKSLTVLDEYERVYCKHGTRIKWKCRCDCGNEFYVDRQSLRTRTVDYCDKCRPVGIRNTRLYHVYYGMKQRCYNPKNPQYKYYGGKGVTICDYWMEDYQNFKNWALENGYIEDRGLSIDRIDSDGNYEPDNCEWVTVSENTRRSDVGKHKNHTKLKDVYGVSPNGEKIDINNIEKFCRDNGLNVSSVNASLHGRRSCEYNGWVFHSDKSRPEKCIDYRTHNVEEKSA